MRGNFKISALKKTHIPLFNFKSGVNGRIDGHLAKNTLAETSYNFDYSDGALKCGVGIEKLAVTINGINYVPEMPEGLTPLKVFYYKRYDEAFSRRDDRILVLFTDNDVYEWKIYSGTNNMTKVNGLNFLKIPFSVNYRLSGEDVILFSTEGTLYVYNGLSVSEYSAPEITSMCIHNERLFATTGRSETRLWFSKTFDPTNWNVSLDEAGYIDFRTKQGGLLKAVSIDGYLYVFKNYGIIRITSYNNQLDMSAENLYVNSGRILRNSVTECGSYVIYLAEDGFYRFNGASSVRIMGELDRYLKGIDNENISTVYYNGKFYAAMNLKIGGELSRYMVCYDTSTGGFYLAKGLYIHDIEKIEGDGFSVLSILSEGYKELGTLSSDGCKFGIPLTKLWRSNKTDFGIFGEKTVAYISLYTRSGITMDFKSEYGSKSVTFDGDEALQKKPVGLKGKTFTVTIKSRAGNAEVSKVLLEIQYL